MNDQAPASFFSRWKTLLSVLTIGIPVLGAIPTAVDVYYGWKHDIPWWDVQHRVEQAGIWESNAECKIKYRALSTGTNTVVHVSSCPETGDILLKISVSDRDSVFEWIAFNSLRKPGDNPSFFDQLIPSARAGEGTAAGVRMAQATSQVICQSKEGVNIVLVVNEGDKCFRETFSPFKGRVEKREEVPCENACPVPPPAS